MPRTLLSLTLAFFISSLLFAQNAPAQDAGETGIKESVSPEADDEDTYTVWTRIRNGFKIPEMDNEVVDRNMASYARRSDYLQRMADRSQKYLYHIIEEVEERGMPTEIALLPFVESAFVTDAKSRVKAAGLWQFMPATGKDFDLQQNMWKDSRYDVLQSTFAALTFLQQLYDEFQDWPLALAAYNWGPGNVRRAIKRNQAQGLPTDYMSLKMPAETRNYYPKLQAIKNIVLNPHEFGVTLPNVYNEPYFIQIFKEQDIDVKRAASLAGMSLSEFVTLNPSFNRPVIVASHNHSMLLPSEKIDSFVENLASFRTSGKPLSSWTTYRVGANDTIESIAKKAHMSEQQFREANQIPPGRIIKPGSLVLVSRKSGLGEAEDISSDTIDATFTLAQEFRRISYRVRKGDTLARVAKRLGVTPATVMKANRLTSKRLRPGQTLVVSVPAVSRQISYSASEKPVTDAKTTKFYVVRKGDTLTDIASRYNVSVEAIQKANDISGRNIFIGQRLTINAAGVAPKQKIVREQLPAKLQKQAAKRPLASNKTYTVRKGDTLFSIAAAANISVDRLKALNGLRGSALKRGQTLKLSR